MDTLGKLFGSPARVKIMRLFLQNQGAVFPSADIALRAKVKSTECRRELSGLLSAGFIKKKAKGWILNSNFPRLEILRVLLVGSEIINKNDLADRFRGVGKLRFLAVAGVFIQSKESRVDLLFVGDNLKKPRVESIVKVIEAELGQELTYALFETAEFMYRLNMYDKLISDILERPHEVIIESKELSLPTGRQAHLST